MKKLRIYSDSLISLLKENAFFLIAVTFACTGLGCWLFLSNKGDEVIWINQHRTVLLDHFFIYFTHLGDGLALIPLFLFFIWKNKKYALLFVLSYLVNSGITQSLKHFLFKDFNRPRFILGDKLNYIPNIDVHVHNSFPSGHSNTGMMLFLVLALTVQNKPLGILFAVLGILVGISRMYLCQHFGMDVLAGWSIALIVTPLLFAFGYPSSQRM